MVQTQKRNWRVWLVLGLILAVLLVLFAKKVTQLSLPGLDVSPKTAVIDPKCPTPQQKEENLETIEGCCQEGLSAL